VRAWLFFCGWVFVRISLGLLALGHAGIIAFLAVEIAQTAAGH